MTSRSLRGLPVCFCNWIYLVTNFKLFSLLCAFVCLVLIHFVAVVVVSEINLFDLIPTNTFSAWQPLNVACYGPAKREWCRILISFYRESRKKTVQKPAFPRLLKVIYEKAFLSKPENLMSGFRKTGLYIQDNKNAILKRKLLPSKTLISNLEQPTTSTSTSQSANNEPFTPHKVMRLAIISSICSPISDSTRKALQNAVEFKRSMERCLH